MSRVSDM